jgi:hypothetical protein
LPRGSDSRLHRKDFEAKANSTGARLKIRFFNMWGT